MDTGRRHRQGAVDCRSKRMDQIRPFWCVHPQRARAARAEMALSGAGPAAAIPFQLGAVDAEPFATDRKSVVSGKSVSVSVDLGGRRIFTKKQIYTLSNIERTYIIQKK